jgi:peptidoglycan/LPS O-acetylase OafA/YrhL
MRFVLLDLIRIGATVCIVANHIDQVTRDPAQRHVLNIAPFYDVALGTVGVTIFLILSGLVLELKHRSRVINYGRFVGRRFLRIYPTYYLTLFLGMALYFGRNYHNSGHFSPPSSVVDLIGSLTGFYAFFGRWGGPFVLTSWYIGLIVTMYLMYPYIAKSISNHPHIVITALFLISVLSRSILWPYSYSYDTLLYKATEWFPLCRVFEFGLGIYLANIAKQNVWLFINGSEKVKSIIIEFVASLSFPMFLVHFPLLFLITSLSKRGFHQVAAVITYIGVSALISWMILVLDKHIQDRIALRWAAR